MNMDRISNLPLEVLGSILVQLPLKEAVRTSVLSSKWRHKWTSLPHFVLDDKIFPSSMSLDKFERWDHISRIIRQVQRNTTGPIETFKLAAYCRPDHYLLAEWVAFLSGKGLKEFVLKEFDSPKWFKFPFDLLSSSLLRRLELFGCMIKLPPAGAFEGLSSLTSLQLNNVFVDTDTLECLILKCPVLESLTLFDFEKAIFLKIKNTRLKYLKISSAFRDICLLNNPLLATVDICLRIPPVLFMEQKDCNLVRTVGCLHGVKRLVLSAEFLVFLGNCDVPERLCVLLDNLTSLELREVRVDNIRHMTVLLCLLKSAPNLEELSISVDRSRFFSKPVTDFVKAQCSLGLSFNSLKVVKTRGIFESGLDWILFELLLAHSPVLESMSIARYGGVRIPEEHFWRLKRASERVKIFSFTSTD